MCAEKFLKDSSKSVIFPFARDKRATDLKRTGRTSAKMYNAPINFAFFIFFKRPAAVASLCMLSNSCSVCITPQYCCFIASTDLSKLSHLVLQAFFSFLANTFLPLVQLTLTSLTFVSTFINNAIRLGEFSKCFHVCLSNPDTS